MAPFITLAQRPLGTDVSGYQDEYLNWTAIKNDGVSFAWVKATESTTYVNPYFSEQLSGAASAGVYVGAYHFARPSHDPNITGNNSADSEAAYFWSVAGSYVKSGYLVPMLDWEDPLATNGAGFTITFMSAWVNEWCNDIVSYAAADGIVVRPVVYTGTWYSVPSGGVSGYPGLNSSVTTWPDWIAAYPADANAQTGSPSGTSPWSGWNIWQYGDTNWSGGDSDVFNGNLQGFLQLFEIDQTNAPYFVSSPGSLLVNAGTNITFSSKASGPSLSFQWRLNGNAIPGATSSNLTIVSVQVTNAGEYTVTASNSYATTSAGATLSVIGPLVNAPGAGLDPSNMVNWWSGNGNGFDIYGVSNATPFGNLSYTNAKVGMGFRFDGTSAYLSNNATEIAPPWTVCAWVYLQDSPEASATLLGDGTYAIKLQQYGATGNVGISHSGVADYYFNTGLPFDTWTFLAIAYTNTQIELYTNGAAVTRVLYTNGVFAPFPSGFELPRAYIGADTFSGSPSDFPQGAVNELQVYNRMLSASEISSIYHDGSAGLVRAPQFTGITNLNNGQVQLNLIGQTGKSITLRSSTNLLSNWSTLGSVPNPTGATNYTDSTTVKPQTFYQATQKY